MSRPTPALLVVSLLLSACLTASERESRAEGAQAELRVVRGEFTQRRLLTGELHAARGETLYVPRTPSWQTQIRWVAADGADVRAGDRLLDLDNTRVASTLAEKRVAAEQAADEVERLGARAAAEAAAKALELERAKTALEKARIAADLPPDLLARRDYEDRQLALAKAQAERDKADDDLAALRRANQADLEVQRIALDKARREIAAAEKALTELTLQAPRDGVFVLAEDPRTGRKLQEGDTVWVDMPVGNLPDLTSLEVRAALSDVDDGRLAVGQGGHCRLDAYPDLETPCTVEEIAPVAQETGPNTARRAFRVRLSLERVDIGRMRPGMSVKAVIEVPLAGEWLLLPRAALDLGSEPRARLASGDWIEVRLGPCNAQRCVVEDGLAEGTVLAPAHRGAA